MPKGEGDESAIIIVGLIVVGIIVLFLYFQNSGSLSLPGFLQSSQIVYSDDVIQVTDKFIPDLSVFEGQKTTIEFIVVNNGPKDVTGITVSLDPPTGFTSSVKCGEKASCTFDLQKGEPVDVTISLTAAEGITQITSADIHYSVSYNYDGERQFRMPIVNSKNPPRGQEFSVSSNSYGPIHLEYGAPQARPISGGGAAVYAYSDIPFDMSFHVVHVGSPFGRVEPILMTGEMLKFDRLDGFDIVRCDKVDKDTKALIDFSTTTSERLSPFAGFEVPFDFECSFQPNKQDEFYEGAIGVKWSYPYKMLFSDTFTILPKEEKDLQAPGSPSAGAPSDSGETPGSGGPSQQPQPSQGSDSPGTLVPTGLSITTDKPSYTSGQSITVSGTTSPPVSSSASIVGNVYDSSGNLVHIFQPQADSSGSFTSTFAQPATAKKGQWRISVTVGASSSNSLSDETTITVS